jgi:hypothetical protein
MTKVPRCFACKGVFVKGDDIISVWVQTSKQTHWSPAEYDEVDIHSRCENNDRDEAYEGAAARYDGEGKDWR